MIYKKNFNNKHQQTCFCWTFSLKESKHCWPTKQSCQSPGNLASRHRRQSHVAWGRPSQLDGRHTQGECGVRRLGKLAKAAMEKNIWWMATWNKWRSHRDTVGNDMMQHGFRNGTNWAGHRIYMKLWWVSTTIRSQTIINLAMVRSFGAFELVRSE